MKKYRILRALLVAAAALALAFHLVGCDADPSPVTARPTPVETPTITLNPTQTDIVRSDLAEVIRDRDPYRRARKLGTLIPTLGAETYPAAKQILEDPSLELKAVDYELLLRYWATHAPEEAAQWARNRSPRQYRAATMLAALTTWAEADPWAARLITWPWAIESPALESVIMVGLVRGWHARGNPPELREFLAKLPPGIFRQRAITAYIRVVLQTDGADEVIRWAEAVPESSEGYKLAVFRRVVDELSSTNVEAGIQFCEAHCLGPYGKNMRNLIARNWVMQDGPAALAWLESTPAGRGRDFDLQITYGKWSRLAKGPAMAWMADQLAGGEPVEWLGPAIHIYAKLLVHEDPKEAVRLAGQIEGNREREDSLIKIARIWLANDEAAAEAWLEQSPLSDESREKARTAPERAAPMVSPGAPSPEPDDGAAPSPSRG